MSWSAESTGGPELILAIDQGTTNSKVLIVDAGTGHVVAQGDSPTGITHPAPGRVEQDPAQLWAATGAAAARALDASDHPPLSGICLTNQRETVVCWNRRTGAPLGPALGWQDSRTEGWCRRLEASHPAAAALVRSRTGLGLDPMFSAPKMRAALRAAVEAGTPLGDVAIGTVDSWLVWNLTGEHRIELGNASRTLLLDLETLEWDHELLELFDIPRSVLPQIVASDAPPVPVRPDGPLPAGTPLLAVLADSHAALFHHRCTTPGSAKVTYGTGSSVMTPTPTPHEAPPGIATTLAWHVGGAPTYAREGNIVDSGSALDWMARTLGAPADVPGGRFVTDLAGEVPHSDGVTFVPAFSGLGAPHFDRTAVAVIAGMTGGTRPAHLARAAVDAVAHQVADVVAAIESDGATRIETLHADGGATASPLLMQTQADLLGRELVVAPSPVASALGVAALAARTLGHDLPPPAPGTTVRPTPGDREARRGLWSDAVARARGRHPEASPTDPEHHERNHP